MATSRAELIDILRGVTHPHVNVTLEHHTDHGGIYHTHLARKIGTTATARFNIALSDAQLQQNKGHLREQIIDTITEQAPYFLSDELLLDHARNQAHIHAIQNFK